MPVSFTTAEAVKPPAVTEVATSAAEQVYVVDGVGVAAQAKPVGQTLAAAVSLVVMGFQVYGVRPLFTVKMMGVQGLPPAQVALERP